MPLAKRSSVSIVSPVTTATARAACPPKSIEQLRKLQNADNAEAVAPPTLTGVGHKLRTPWMKQVLTGAGRARPWMALRMPQFGEANVGRLPEEVAALEGTLPDEEVHKTALTAVQDRGRPHSRSARARSAASPATTWPASPTPARAALTWLA